MKNYLALGLLLAIDGFSLGWIIHLIIWRVLAVAVSKVAHERWHWVPSRLLWLPPLAFFGQFA